MFVDRQAELVFLDAVLARKRPTEAQFILLYGRRRTLFARDWLLTLWGMACAMQLIHTHDKD